MHNSKLIHRNWRAYQIILVYYLSFIILAILGRLIIYFPSVSVLTCLIVLVYVISFTGGAYIGGFFKFPTVRIGNFISVNRLLLVCAIFLTIGSLFTWAILIKKYNSLSEIFLYANFIRYENIGQDTGLFPRYLTYPTSIIYGCFAMSLAAIGWTNEIKYKILTIYFFLLIFVNDLSLFGRIGMVYALACVAAFFLIFKVKVFSSKRLIIICLAFLILLTPRFVRRGGEGIFYFDEAINTKTYMKVQLPDTLVEVVDVYKTFVSSAYALDYYLDNNVNSPLTYGLRTFTPVIRIARRFSGTYNYEATNTIDYNALNLPFEHNVYTIIRDLYSDFGLWGISILPFIFGLLMGGIYKLKSIAYDAIKIYAFAWFFYSILYNAFSFGGFVISFIFLIILSLFIKPTGWHDIQRKII